MKKLIPLIMLALTACDTNTSLVVQPETPQSMRRVAGNSLGDVYVVRIDGADYIVILGAYKAAICRK